MRICQYSTARSPVNKRSIKIQFSHFQGYSPSAYSLWPGSEWVVPVPDCLFPLFCSGWQLERTQPNQAASCTQFGHQMALNSHPLFSKTEKWVYVCGTLFLAPKIPSADLGRGRNGWPFVMRRTCQVEKTMSSIQRSHPRPLCPKWMARDRLLFSCRLCATGLRWLGCADHPFLVIHPAGGSLGSKVKEANHVSYLQQGDISRAVRTVPCQ